MAFGITYLLRSLRDRIFLSGNYFFNIMRATTRHSNDQYKPKTPMEQTESVKNKGSVYDEIKREKAEESGREQRLPDPHQVKQRRDLNIGAKFNLKAREQLRKEPLNASETLNRNRMIEEEKFKARGSVYSQKL